MSAIAAVRRRIGGIQVALRLAIVVTGAAALLLPLSTLSGPPAAVSLCGAVVVLLAALQPDGPWTSCVLYVSLLAWLLTGLTAGAPSAGLVLAYAVVLYVLHRIAALAAVLPTTGRTASALTARWLLRTLAVPMCCLPLSGALLLAPHPARSVVAGAVGLAVAVGSGAVLAVLLHRRQPE